MDSTGTMGRIQIPKETAMVRYLLASNNQAVCGLKTHNLIYYLLVVECGHYYLKIFSKLFFNNKKTMELTVTFLNKVCYYYN